MVPMDAASWLAEHVFGPLAAGIWGMFGSLLKGALTWSMSAPWASGVNAGPANQPDTTVPPSSVLGPVATMLSYAKWVGLAAGVAGLIVWAVSAAIGVRRGGSERLHSGLMVGVGAVLAGGGVSLASWLASSAAYGLGTGSMGTIQRNIWWIGVMICGVVLVIGGGVVAWSQRGEDLNRLASSVVTFVGTNALGMSLIMVGTGAGDAFAGWILGVAVNAGSGCAPYQSQFDSCVSAQFAGSNVEWGTLSIGMLILMIILALIGLVGALFQFVMFGLQQAMSSILVAAIPVASSFTFFQAGKDMYRKVIGWIVALMLFKPVAALVYATGLALLNPYNAAAAAANASVGTGIASTIYGVAVVVLAALALPVLMRLVVPQVAVVSGGSGAAGVIAAGAGMAMMLRFGGGARAGGASGGATPPPIQSPAGANGSAGPSGTGTTGSTGSSGPPGGTGLSGSAGSPGATGAVGSTGAVGASGASGAAGAAGAAGVAGAAGPVGMAAAVGVQVARSAVGASSAIANSGASMQGTTG